MGKVSTLWLLALLFLLGGTGYSQTRVEISDPKISMEGNVITISYDILNSSPGQTFDITLTIKDEDGNVIRAQSLEGDIGEGVSGGSNKTITWDLEADQVFVDAFFIVQVHANIILPAPEEAALSGAHEYNRAGIIAQSIAFPGLGLSRVTGKPHWIKGVAAYGCLAGGIVMNRLSANTYNGIEDFDLYTDAREAYDKAVQQDKISQGLFFAAIGIWIVDIVWTAAGTTHLRKPALTQGSKGVTIYGTMDPVSKAPMLSLNYRF